MTRTQNQSIPSKKSIFYVSYKLERKILTIYDNPFTQLA